MRVRLSTFFLVMLFVIAAGQDARAASSKVEILLQEANKLFADSKDNLALEKFEEALHVEPKCYEALWKASLLNSRIGNRYSDLMSKMRYFENAWHYADAALCVDSADADANYVMALAVYNKSLASGVKERMQRSKVIKYFLDEALKAKSDHADALQLLGRWHFKNANLSLAERSAVNLFFGGVPLGASNEQAIEALQKAIKYNPSNVSYYYDLACVYREIENPDLSMAMLQEAINLKAVTSEEMEVSRRCKAMLQEMDRT